LFYLKDENNKGGLTVTQENIKTFFANDFSSELPAPNGIANITDVTISPLDPEMQQFWATDVDGTKWLIAVKSIPDNVVMIGTIPAEYLTEQEFFYHYFFLQFYTQTIHYKE